MQQAMLDEGVVETLADVAPDIKLVTVLLSRSIAPKPGQYLMLAESAAPEVVRPYSLVRYDEQARRAVFCIKRKGKFTNRLWELAPGARLLVRGPFGRFILPENPQPIVMLAGGIGITPFIAMARDIVRRRWSAPVHLFVSVRNRGELPFADELQTMDPPVHVHVRVTDTQQRLAVDEVLSVVPADSRFYLCGPAGMMSQFRTGLQERGIENGRILSESFTPGR